MSETQALGRQAINPRGQQVLRPITSGIHAALIVTNNNDDIGFNLLCALKWLRDKAE